MTDEELRELLIEACNRGWGLAGLAGAKAVQPFAAYQADAILAALREAGLAVVPVEASIDMIQAGQGWHGLQQAWADMIEAGRIDRE